MSPTRRIILNIVATYGRSLYALAIGLFCGRWTLMALGKVDYGLIGVVGGMTTFVAFLNNLMSAATARFFAIGVGGVKKFETDGMEECRKWFATAVSVHTVLPLALMLIGYPVGEWAVRCYLTIPPERIADCIWVWRFTCLSSFVGMVCVPLSAMYGAHQYIAELTVYSFITSTLNVIVLHYMVTHPGVWLTKFSLWTCLLSIVPRFIIAIRAVFLFPECRLRLRYLYDIGRILQLGHYAFWQLIGGLGVILRGQGMAILVNKCFGPMVNAASSAGNSLSGHANTFAASMSGAFAPAIMNAYGAGDMVRFRSLSSRVCKYGTLLVLIFAIPLALEHKEVLRLWLKNPPEHAGIFCVAVLICQALDRLSYGYSYAINAKGRIARYQIVVGGLSLVALPVAWMCIQLGLGIPSIAIGLVLTMILRAFSRPFFARSLLGFSVRYWFFRIFLPLVLLTMMVVLIGTIPMLFRPPSFIRVCQTTFLCEIVLLPFAYLVVLDKDERLYVSSKLHSLKIESIREKSKK